MSKIQELINSIKSTEGELRYTPEVNYYKREGGAANSKDYQDTASLYKGVLRQSSIDSGKATIAQDKVNENAIKRVNEAISYTNYRTPEPKELVLGSGILPNKQPQSIAKVEKPVSAVNNSRSLLQSLKSAPREFAQSALKMLGAAWDFGSRNTQKAANLLSPFLNTGLISTFKALGDKDLANVSYDEIWRNEIKGFEDRVIEIGKPTAYFESLITQDNPQESQLFMGMTNNIAIKTNEAINKGDTKGILEGSAKLAGIGFMREFANVLWILGELTKVETPMKSFKLDNPKTLMRFTVKPSGAGLIGSKVKVEPYTEIYKLELKGRTPYYNEAGKLITPKAPEVYAIGKLNKDGSTTINVINKGGEILNKNIISNFVQGTEGTSAVSKVGGIAGEIAPAVTSKGNIMSRVAAITQASKMALPAPRIAETVKDTGISTKPLLEAPVAPERIVVAPNRTVSTERIVPTNNSFPESKIKKTLYHGTQEDFDNFDFSKTGTNTDHPNSKWGIFFADNPKLSKDFVGMTKGAGDTRPTKMIEANIDMKNPLDFTIKGLFTNKKQASIIYEAMTGEKLSPKEALEMIDENVGLGDIGDFFEELYGNTANKKLFQDAGYDGIIAEMGRDDGKVYKEYVVFEPSQVKINNKRILGEKPKPEKKIVEQPKTNITQNPLEQEAKKYKSAEEFVNNEFIKSNQENLYQEIRQLAREIKNPEQINDAVIEKFGVDPEITLYRGVNKGLKASPFESDTASKVGRFWSPNKAHSEIFVRGDGKMYEIKVKASDLLKSRLNKTTELAEREIMLGGELQQNATESLTKSQLTDIWNKAHKLKPEVKKLDEIDLKFEAEKAKGKTPSQIFAEKSKAAQERFKSKNNVAKIVEEAKKPKDLTIRKKDITPVEKKIKQEATEAELIHDINKAELDMDKYEIGDPRWDDAAMKHAALSVKYENLTGKSLLDDVIEEPVESKIKKGMVDPSFVEEYDSFVSYKKGKPTRLKELDELEKEFDLLRKKYPEEYARIDGIVERGLKIQSGEIRFNLQEEVEKGIRELGLKITRTKNPRAAEYYSKGVIAIRSIHDVPSIVHGVAHSYFDTKKISLENLPTKAQEELKAYAEIKGLGKIDEGSLLVRKEVLPFFIEDVVKISGVKAKYPNIYRELFKKDGSLYDKDTVSFYNRMEENIRLYTTLTSAKKAESLMFAGPKSMSFGARLKLFRKKNSYVRGYDKTQQALIDESHGAKVADRNIADAFGEKIDYNKPFLDFTSETGEKYNSLHRLSRGHDKLLRYVESNLVYNPSRPGTWTLGIDGSPRKISEYSIGELNHDLDTMSMSIKKDGSASTMVRREFGALLISRRFTAFKQNQQLLESNLEKAKETIKEIKYKAKALRDAYPMMTDSVAKKTVNKKIYKYRLEVRNLKKYVEAEKAGIKKMKEMIESDHMTTEEREMVVKDLEPKYREQLKKYDSITKAEIDLLHEQGLVTDAQREAYAKQGGYATFLRSTLEDFKSRFSVKKKNASSTKTKEIDANDSAIVNPLDSMPYLQMETMREYSYQRFLNELYKRKKLGLVADLGKGDLTGNTVGAYKAFTKGEKGDWAARTFRILEPDNLLSESIESIFMTEGASLTQRVLDAILGNPARIFQKLTTTYNPYFAIFKNIFLDFATSILLSKTGYIPIVSQISEIVKGIRSETYRNALLQNFQDYKAMGGFDMSKSYVDPRHVDVEKVIGDMLKSKGLRDAIRGRNPLKIAKEFVRLVPRGAKTLSAITETFTRFTEFQRAVNKGYSKLDAMELASKVSGAFDRRGSQAKKAFRYMPYVNAAFQLAEQNISVGAQMFKGDKNKMARFAALVGIYSTIAYLAVKEKTEKVKNAETEEDRETALEELYSYMDKAVYKKLGFTYLGKLKSGKEFKIPTSASFSAPGVLLAQRDIKELFPSYEADYKDIALSGLGGFVNTGIAPEELSGAGIMGRVLGVTPLSSTVTGVAGYRVYPVLSEINSDNDKKDPSSAFTKDTNKLAVWLSNIMMPEVSPKQIEQVLRSSASSLGYILGDILGSLALTDSQYKALGLTPYNTRELLLDRPLKSYMIEDAGFMSSGGKLTTDMYDRIKAMEEHKIKLEKLGEAKMDLLESGVEVRDEDLEDLMLLTEAYGETEEGLKILNDAREVSTYIKDWNNSGVLKEMTTASERNAMYRFLTSFLSGDLEGTSQEDFRILEMIRAGGSALKESTKVKLK